MHVPPVSAPLQTCFSRFVGIYLRTSVILHGLISFRNSSRLPWQLSVRFYSMARSRYISPEKWGGSEFACFVRLSIVFFECYFKPFLCLLDVKKPKNLGGGTPPPGPPTRALLWICYGAYSCPGLPDPQLLCTTRVSCTYSLGVAGATNVDFFFQY